MDLQVQNRVTDIFEKLNLLSSSVQDEKNNRFQSIHAIIQQFDQNMKSIEKSKEERFSYLGQQLRILVELVESESEIRQRNELETQKILTDLDRNSRRVIEANMKDRVETERKIAYALNQQLDQLTQDVNKEGLYLESFTNEDLPKIADDLQNEILERKEVEEKIYHQFIEQINDLKDLFDKEKRERETREEEIIEILRSIQIRISENLRRSRIDREKTEEQMIQLVEQVIEKIKHEMIQMNI